MYELFVRFSYNLIYFSNGNNGQLKTGQKSDDTVLIRKQ